MNATVPANLRIASSRFKTCEVNVYGFPMECQYDYDPAEPESGDSVYGWQPGSPANATLIECRIGGVKVDDMLSLEQKERIEEAILTRLEQ